MGYKGAKSCSRTQWTLYSLWCHIELLGNPVSVQGDVLDMKKIGFDQISEEVGARRGRVDVSGVSALALGGNQTNEPSK